MVKWIKQMFGIKEEPKINEDALDALMSREKFKNATPTNELVISASNSQQVAFNELTEDNLKKMTKNQLEELAKSELGIELDKRELKANLIKQILNNQ